MRRITANRPVINSAIASASQLSGGQLLPGRSGGKQQRASDCDKKIGFASKPDAHVHTMRSNMQHVSPYRYSRLTVILLVTILAILWGNAAMAMTLNSSAFQQNGPIPSKYTCEGEDISPPLAWEGVPNGAKSLVLIIDDPDAPDPKAPKMVWVHWVVYNIPTGTESLQENAGKTGLPPGALLGLNDFKKDGVRWSLSTDRPAPLLPQTLCAGYHAPSQPIMPPCPIMA